MKRSLILCFALILLSGCTNGGETARQKTESAPTALFDVNSIALKVYKGGGYSLLIPEGWHEMTDAGIYTLIVTSTNGLGEISILVNGWSAPLGPNAGVDRTKLADKLLKVYREMSEGKEVVETDKDIPLRGTDDAAMEIYRYKDAETGTKYIAGDVIYVAQEMYIRMSVSLVNQDEQKELTFIKKLLDSFDPNE